MNTFYFEWNTDLGAYVRMVGEDNGPPYVFCDHMTNAVFLRLQKIVKKMGCKAFLTPTPPGTSNYPHAEVRLESHEKVAKFTAFCMYRTAVCTVRVRRRPEGTVFRFADWHANPVIRL
jgi:hypothetical protein